VRPQPKPTQEIIRGALVSAIAESQFHANGAKTSDGWLVKLALNLQRVLRLPTNLRHCFVLRVLAGLSRQDCADLLRVGERQVDKRCGGA
jgi:DNA-directed RNA polymerase specialized sigma24 family protein